MLSTSPNKELVSPLNEDIINILLDATRAAAAACYPWIGRKNEKSADGAAVKALRHSLNQANISGVIVIGEGERDKAPMLYIGEEVGNRSGLELDIALDPLEGTTLCAYNLANSISVIAVTERGGLLHAPDVYMHKIAVGPNLPAQVVSLEQTVTEDLSSLAAAKKRLISDLVVCVLDRPRHETMIEEIKTTGAQIKMISDGDILASLSAAFDDDPVDIYMGIGGAPEGVLAAAALKGLGGQMQGKLILDDQKTRERANKMGITNFERIYNIDDMVVGDVLFCATGVTSGDLLKGVKVSLESAEYHSIIISSVTGTATLHRLL